MYPRVILSVRTTAALQDSEECLRPGPGARLLCGLRDVTGTQRDRPDVRKGLCYPGGVTFPGPWWLSLNRAQL
ncbi:hypothetical protein AGOR_G00219030 [Albula goreensis]|uniref:Uncharacterized protein n=1 Tax=Albula goreensis TaxID=1534307 RepID=A0A8T3CND3_9TELE|nr:hypothetical protein AGOR_G00219030 [Albula goreensis]